MNRLLDNLLIFTAIALLCTVAVLLAFKYGDYYGRRAEYEARLAKCSERYPPYRCRVELGRYYDVHTGDDHE